MVDALTKHSLSEFTRAEFLDFVERISRAEGATEKENDEWVDHFAKLVEPHPKGTDIMFWPEEGADDSPEGIVSEVERFCRENKLPCFKDCDS
ncbi:bacteriocin immunity protein [Paracoccus saliphilus]|uniref:Bacteriocin immunity protein n=1 Tax=Paracoccus saliphilus TaxID=405559 RepID=A0AA46A5F4_9RHOB|nr:bacteriocin immunity protein [Paracoccus saliphilus]WCR04279.1 bacteriocin immunity protein [Paracoccus saliphilus]SIS80097.1 Colicin immunity protein / pyocin immunity protein [Paracoccus saliphilus]